MLWFAVAPAVLVATIAAWWRHRHANRKAQDISLQQVSVIPLEGPLLSITAWRDWLEDMRSTVGITGEIREVSDSYGSRLTIRLQTGATIDIWIDGPPYMKCPRVRDSRWEDADEGLMVQEATRDELERVLLQARARCNMNATSSLVLECAKDE